MVRSVRTNNINQTGSLVDVRRLCAAHIEIGLAIQARQIIYAFNFAGSSAQLIGYCHTLIYRIGRLVSNH
jgi:hypothetical protein